MAIKIGELHCHKMTGVAEAAGIVGQLFVKFTSEPNEYEQADAVGEQVDGVAIFDALAGEAFTFNKQGATLVTSSAAVAAGALVTTDAAGKAITAISTNIVAGKALEAAVGADEEITIELFDAGYVLP